MEGDSADRPRSAMEDPDGIHEGEEMGDEVRGEESGSSGITVTKSISLHTLAGKEIATIDADPSWCLRDLQRCVYEKDGTLIPQIHIINGATKLEDGVALVDAGIDDGSRLTLIRSAVLFVVTGSQDYSAKVWNAESGECLHTLRGHRGDLVSVVFSFDGAEVLTASDDRTARTWSTQTGECVHTFSGHRDGVTAAAFSTDDAWVVTASKDRTARIWSTTSGDCLRVLTGHRDAVLSAMFAPGGAKVLTGSRDGTARIWSVETGRKEKSTFEGPLAYFSPDGARVLTLSGDSTARLWSAEWGKWLCTLQGHRDVVLSAAFSSNSARVVTASRDGHARVWHTASGKCLLKLVAHRDAVLSASFSNDGTKVLTGSVDGSAAVWDMAEGQRLSMRAGHGTAIESVASPTGTQALTPASMLQGHGAAIQSVTFSPNSAHALTASNDCTAIIWDIASGELVRMMEGHKGPVTSASYLGR
mmetsp:Transcript_115777/g.291293  ORF Transcript_115777/g.291293 Transcript_115777/m.291293 type:complete len:474 (+) Transcript_115777:65-1486(+)